MLGVRSGALLQPVVGGAAGIILYRAGKRRMALLRLLLLRVVFAQEVVRVPSKCMGQPCSR